jgi:hypothetical protein
MAAGVLKMKNMKNVLLLFLVVGVVFMAGCSNSGELDVNEDISDEEVVVSDAVVARTLSASNVNVGDNIVVTLTKNLDASQTNILVEENFPTGWTVVDAGTGTVAGNTIRWAELTGATSGTYTYTLNVVGTSGTSTWSGQYSINGQTPVDISGSTSVVVK